MSTKVFNNRLLRSAYTYIKYIARYFNVDNAGGASDTGSRFLELSMLKPSTGTLWSYPVYMFDLTAIPLQTTATQVPCIGYRLQADQATNLIGWSPVTGIQLNGSSFFNAGFEPYSGKPLNQAAWGKLLMEYVNMKFTIRGPKARPSRIIASLIQPYKWFDALPNGPLAATANFNSNPGNQIWKQIGNRNCVNLCNNQPSSLRAPWKVLGSKVFEMQPTSTTENDVGGHDIHQRWFWKCNRVMDHQSEGGIAGQDFGDNGDMTNLDIGTQRADTRASWYPTKGSRVYLLIQGYAPQSTTASDPVTAASFDLSIEKKCSTLSGL